MKNIRFITSCLVLAIIPCLYAQESCDLHLMAIVAPQDKTIPQAASEQLFSKLCSAISTNDVYANEDYSRFFVTAKMTPLYKETIPGPPVNTVVSISVTFYLGDYAGEKVFTTQVLNLKGVGNSEERAYINALRNIKADNAKIKKLIVTGKTKIIDYYNRNFETIVAKARQCASMKKDEEALFYITSIPECCNRYEEASQLTLIYYKQYIDNNCRKLVNQARTAWMQNPDSTGAAEVADYLNRIDPDAACYNEAMSLYKEVKEKIKDDWTFEMRKKYSDAISIEKEKIETAKAIGVAYGNGQKEQTTNLMWLK